MDQCDFMDFFDEEMASAFEHDFQNYVSQESNSLCSSNSINILSSNSITSLYNFPGMTPAIQVKLNNDSKRVINPTRASTFPEILNFRNMNPSENPKPVNPEEMDHVVTQDIFMSQYKINSENINEKSQQNNTKSRARPPSQNYDHIIAERRRREHLSRLFISLSGIVPGLKKTDKTSVLGGAVKYLKDLQERVETLEKLSTKTTMESIVVLKKSQFLVEDVASSDEKSGNSGEQMLPEIIAKVMNNNILLKVHCGRQKGVVANLLGKVESLNLVVANTNVTPFGSSALDITITAEMEKEFSLSVKEVVAALREAIQSHYF